MDDFSDSHYEPNMAMARTMQEFQQIYTKHYGIPADLIGDSTGTVQRYQLLRGYLLGKGYSFAEIDAPNGLWPLTRNARRGRHGRNIPVQPDDQP